ncbi:hypothetical protein D3C77_670280 [compost metagenome]
MLVEQLNSLLYALFCLLEVAEVLLNDFPNGHDDCPVAPDDVFHQFDSITLHVDGQNLLQGLFRIFTCIQSSQIL